MPALRLKCKDIYTKMLKDVGIEVPKSIETRSKCSIHADWYLIPTFFKILV